MVATLVAKKLHAPDLVYLSIAGGVDSQPTPTAASTVDPGLLTGARSMVTLTDLFDLAASGRLDTAFLSGVQIDGQGRINMSVIGDFTRPKVRLPGGAGSAAIMPRARRTILWRTRHDPRVFVDRLDFVTAVGNVEYVVTPKCVFARSDGELVVDSIHPWVEANDLAETTGFPINVNAGMPVTPLPSADELEALEVVDPAGISLTEF
jgi:glutaconate CoA-transferase subunit B